MNANNGEIVVAMIDDEATVRRFYKENGHIRLQPENDAMEPIIVPEVMILEGCQPDPEILRAHPLRMRSSCV